MNIGIIGSGHIGGTLARLWARNGHQVAVSNSRGPASLEALVAEIGPNARAVTIDEAAGFGDVVVVAIPFKAYRLLPAERLSRKIVVDAMNYYPQRDGEIDFGTLNSSEVVARFLSGARLVKAFNTIYWERLLHEGRASGPDRLAVFVAGDDAEAKAVVSSLIEEIGFDPVDTGSLREGGRLQQPGEPIYNNPINAQQARELLAAP